MRLNRKHFSAAVLCALFLLLSVSCGTVSSSETAAAEEPGNFEFSFASDNLVYLPESAFSEVWTYVVARNEKYLKASYPLTDVVYFGAEVDAYGSIVDIPRRKSLPQTNARVHVSIACGSSGLTHFLLQPESMARDSFFNALIAMTDEYDGLNIDLEYVPLRDADNFLSLLRQLKEALGEKILSVCVPARTAENTTYNYGNIASIADRVFVMAYDEHWSGSAPGPVASMQWCRDVAAYALKTIGAQKLIMGIPFYGRSWADKATARALIASTTDSIMKDNDITAVEREDGVPQFTYDTNVRITVYFEDAYSLAVRMDRYRTSGVDKIGFWRLGQEDTSVWDYIRIKATAR
ncbi:MAG: glycoside hydrolase [Spirochaetaceae bacterium]|jgi:spore germination protein YaaH|nr:glycoside hydrolase [Spirochaetaceae bacterium]